MRPRLRHLPLLLAFAMLVVCATADAAAAEEASTTGTTTVPAPATATTAPEPPVSTTTNPQPALPSSPSPSTAPSVPEAVKQNAQPVTREGTTHRRGSPVPRGGVSLTPTGDGGSAPAQHSQALPPGSLTPALPPSLAGSLGGVPSFFVNSFSIPPFLLPIYQAAGAAYGIPWQVLAAINEVETDYGRDLSLSSAGAEGWMQFLPSEWGQFGVDVNNDGFEDPYNPADAIFAAARYLEDAGGAHDIRAAVFAYNHSQAYVDSVMLRARLLAGTPPQLLGAVTGLSEARFPVYAPAHFSDGFYTSASGKTLVGTTIYSRSGAPAIAVQDGRIVGLGESRELGRYVSLTDVYGNTYTYAQLGALANVYPVLEGSKRFSLHPLRPGVHVIAGTVLGHLSAAGVLEPHMLFQIRPAGPGAPLIDPKPILDGWVKLQVSSAIRVRVVKPALASPPTPGQALLESKLRLERQLTHDRGVRLASCERRLISDGRVDRRVLADLQFLASSGFSSTVAASSCKAPGSRSIVPALRVGAGSTVDVSAIDDTAVVSASGGASSIAIAAVRRLLSLQGTMRPQSISGPPGVPRAADAHARTRTLTISFESSPDRAHAASILSEGLSPVQWIRLIARLGQIPDPTVSSKPSSAAIPDPQTAPGTGRG
jgi:soluble lytic murein transglycosylase-like protein